MTINALFPQEAVQYFLNRMYMSHISIRMLINQYAFAHGSDIVKPGHIGMIDPYCDVATVINKAYTQAAKICDQHYGAHPGKNGRPCFLEK